MAGYRRTKAAETGELRPKQRRTRADNRRTQYERRYAEAGDEMERLVAACNYLRAVLRSVPASWSTPIAKGLREQVEELARSTDQENVKRR